MLREASAHEARGELGDAEATLLRLLDRQPNSSAAVFALDRVFRTGGRPEAILPVVDAYLETGSATLAVWSLKVRVLTEIDSLAAVAGALEDWIRATPGSHEPYREGARVMLATEGLGIDAAVELLERGLDELGDPPGLLLETGALHFSAGRAQEGAVAWADALGRDRARTSEVIRRLGEMEEDARRLAAGHIVAVLAREPTAVARLEAGAGAGDARGLGRRGRCTGRRSRGSVWGGGKPGAFQRVCPQGRRRGSLPYRALGVSGAA